MAPGFRCEACPNGFDGNHANGYYSQSLTNEYQNQLCEDIDECALGIADCGLNSYCLNTVGSYVCSCNRGFHQNITYGCQPALGMCPDGTFCDKNAVCKHAEGLKVILVFIFSMFSGFRLTITLNSICSITAYVESVLAEMVSSAARTVISTVGPITC